MIDLKKVKAPFLIFLLSLPGLLQSQSLIQAPFSESFNNQPWSISISGTENVDTNWKFFPKRDSLFVVRWGLNMESGGSPGRIVGTAYNDSTGKLLGFSNVFSLFVKPGFNSRGQTETASVLSPRIDLSSLNRPELSFDYHMRGVGILGMTIEAQVGASGQRIVLDSLGGQQQNWGTDHFKRHFVDLSNLPDTIKVRFNVFAQGKYVHAILDNFGIKEASPCLRPNKPAVKRSTATSATLEFAIREHTAQTEVRYGPVGVPVASKGMKSLVFSGDSVQISGLSSHRLYNVYFRPVCGSNPGSYSTYPLIIRTPCKPEIEPFPYKQDFDEWMNDTSQQYFARSSSHLMKYNTRFGDCWEDGGKASVDSLYSWVVGPGVNIAAKNDHSGKGNYVFPDLVRPDTAFLTSPSINLTNSVRPQLSFWYHSHNLLRDPNQLYVDIFNGNTWQSLTSISGPVQSNYDDTWKEKVIDLSGFKDTIKVRFYTDRQIVDKATNWPDPSIFNSGKAIFSLDEVHFREKPGCALAGPDSTVQICDSLLSYDLSGLLDSLAKGGFWRDVKGSGALNGTVLNLNQLPQDSAFPFRYVIPADSACTADSATFTLIRNQAGCSIGLEEYKLPGLDIFPNPAGQRLYLRPHNPQLKWGALALYNLQGQRLPAELSVGAAGQRSLSLAGVPPGVYFIEIELAGKKLVRKIVVEQ